MKNTKCVICGSNKLGFYRLHVQDGVICHSCLKGTPIGEYGASLAEHKRSLAAFWGSRNTSKDFQALTNAGKPVDLSAYKKNAKNEDRNKYQTIKQEFIQDGSAKFENVYFDDNLKRILIDKTLFNKDYTIKNYSAIVGYHPTETGHSDQKKKHGITRTLAGGALLGPVGAIAGAVSSRSKQYDVIDRISVTIAFDDGSSHEIKILSGPIKPGLTTNLSEKELASLTAKLDGIISSEQTTRHSQTIQVASDADEIAKYKKLLDDGAITQSEYDAKKKQLLGL
ncbi:SHOCT domain-containing protein [Lacticaseibacillus paracasei]|uniref:SHOCT domain-containing protein n=2 Tax=Lacticaseibacillus paracasei TaxID=1597 RepID=UPI001F50BC56|nr:SHOCT domain-containing protein [Lacticaseibacillus paracasei]MCI0372891.1 SHOCT domain-containing protein [Lacticaseibacillus paracasei]